MQELRPHHAVASAAALGQSMMLQQSLPRHSMDSASKPHRTSSSTLLHSKQQHHQQQQSLASLNQQLEYEYNVLKNLKTQYQSIMNSIQHYTIHISEDDETNNHKYLSHALYKEVQYKQEQQQLQHAITSLQHQINDVPLVQMNHKHNNSKQQEELSNALQLNYEQLRKIQYDIKQYKKKQLHNQQQQLLSLLQSRIHIFHLIQQQQSKYEYLQYQQLMKRLNSHQQHRNQLNPNCN
jgi:hypothetical protein